MSLILMFLFPRGAYKFCSQYAKLARADNLVRHHFPKCHPNFAPEMHPFLKVGQCPVEGRDHVVQLMDALGTNTERPAPEPLNSEESEQSESDEEPEEENSQQAYDEPPSEEEPPP